MDMPAAAPSKDSERAVPTLPGYSDSRVAPDVQQRIGVALGTVQQTALTMKIRTVGIIRPNETRIAQIHLKTED